MKKIFFILLFSIGVVCISAQERNIKMPQVPKQENYTDYSLKDKGYWWSMDIAISPSLKFHETSAWTSTFSFVNGYRFNDYLKLGIGVGAMYYFANNDKLRNTDIKWAMPIFVNARGNFISQETREIVPFWSVDVGDVIRDGFLISPSIGCRIGERRSAFIVSIGYSYREINVKQESEKGRSFATFKIGYEF